MYTLSRDLELFKTQDSLSGYVHIGCILSNFSHNLIHGVVDKNIIKKIKNAPL